MADPIVLVVDDEPNVVRLCQRLLERSNWQVIVATSPSQALAILARQVVDLLLVDMRMPGLDGFQLISLARRHQPDLTAVVMTGYGTLDVAIAALQQGVDGLILKPFTNAELVQGVQRAMQESQNKRDAARLAALRPLFNVVEALFSETDPRRWQDLVLQVTCKQLRCETAGLYWLDDETDNYRLKASRGAQAPESVKAEWMRSALARGGLTGGALMGDGLAGGDLNGGTLSRSPVVGGALSGDVLPGDTSPGDDLAGGGLSDGGQPGGVLHIKVDTPMDLALKELCAEHGFASIVCAPFSTKGASGLLMAARRRDQSVFREVDLELMLILARQASAALENARLYEELRSTLKRVEKSQRVMLQAEKIAAAGRLTASIAHEINNPLQSLHNCLHLVGRKELSESERLKYLHMAQSELDRLMSTVQRMLDLYRPGARDRQLCDLNEQIKRAAALMEPQFQKNNIIIHCKFAPKLPLVMAVANQIQQVLLNLLINSVEAMPGGGEITITTAYGPQGQRGKDTQRPGVQILISDTGVGIPESEREQIFEPFISTKENGTGLGLAVSYGIVVAHGGTITLVDRPGPGACFRIILPEENRNES